MVDKAIDAKNPKDGSDKKSGANTDSKNPSLVDQLKPEDYKAQKQSETKAATSATTLPLFLIESSEVPKLAPVVTSVLPVVEPWKHAAVVEAPKATTAGQVDSNPQGPEFPKSSLALPTNTSDKTVNAFDSFLNNNDGAQATAMLKRMTYEERQQFISDFSKSQQPPISIYDAMDRATKSTFSMRYKEELVDLLERPKMGPGADAIATQVYDCKHNTNTADVSEREKLILDTLSILRPDEIKSLPKDVMEFLADKDNKSFSDEFRKILPSFLTGTERSQQNFNDIALEAIKRHDLELFMSAMSQAKPEWRKDFQEGERYGQQVTDAFAVKLPDAKTGDHLEVYDCTSLRMARDYASYGELSASTKIENTSGLLTSCPEALDHVLDQISPLDRAKFRLGLSLEKTGNPDGRAFAEMEDDQLNKMSSAERALYLAGKAGRAPKAIFDEAGKPVSIEDCQKFYESKKTQLLDQSKEYYDTIHGALKKTQNGNEGAELERLEAKIMFKESAVFKDLANISGSSAVKDRLARMSDYDKEELRNDPMFKASLAKLLADSTGSKAAEMMEFALSVAAHKAPANGIESLQNQATAADLARVLFNMSADDLAHLKAGKTSDADRKDKDLAERVGKSIMKCWADKNADVTAIKELEAKLEAGHFSSQAVKDIINSLPRYKDVTPAEIAKSFHDLIVESKSLQSELNGSNGSETREMLELMARSQMSKENYEKFLKPMLESKDFEIPMIAKIDLVAQGGKKDQVIDELGKLSKSEKDGLLNALNASAGEGNKSTAEERAVAASLSKSFSSSELAVIKNILGSGDQPPAVEDQLRAVALGLSTVSTELATIMRSISEQQKEAIETRYEEKYGKEAAKDLASNKSAKDSGVLERLLSPFQDTEAQVVDAIKTRAGEKTFSSTMADYFGNVSGNCEDAKDKVVAATADVSKGGQDLPPAMRDQLLRDFYQAEADYDATKGQIADKAIDVVLMAGGALLAPYAEGLSLGKLMFAYAVTSGAATLAHAEISGDFSASSMAKNWFLDTVSIASGGITAESIAKFMKIGNEVAEMTAKQVSETALGDTVAGPVRDEIKEQISEKVSEYLRKVISGSAKYDASSIETIAADVIGNQSPALSISAQKLAKAIQSTLESAMDTEAKSLMASMGNKALVNGLAQGAIAAVNGAAAGLADGGDVFESIKKSITLATLSVLGTPVSIIFPGQRLRDGVAGAIGYVEAKLTDTSIVPLSRPEAVPVSYSIPSPAESQKQAQPAGVSWVKVQADGSLEFEASI